MGEDRTVDTGTRALESLTSEVTFRWRKLEDPQHQTLQQMALALASVGRVLEAIQGAGVLTHGECERLRSDARREMEKSTAGAVGDLVTQKQCRERSKQATWNLAKTVAVATVCGTVLGIAAIIARALLATPTP